MLQRLPPLVMVLMALSIGCRTPQRGDDSLLLHAEGQPTRAAVAWQWETPTDREFDSVVIPFMELGGPERFLPPGHALAQRAQFWVDRIDELLREDFPERLQGVPKPIARIWKNADPNAFVSSVPVCLDAEIRFAVRDNLKRVADQAFLAPSGVIETPSSPLCVQRRHTAESLAAFVAWYDHEHPSCTLQVEREDSGRSLVTAASDCRLGGPLDRRAGAKNLVFFATSPYVIFHSGIFAAYPDEAQFVAIVAHELGHYYRGHGGASEERYNYYYKLKDNAAAGRPAPDDSLREFGLSVNEASRLLYGQKRIAGQRYPSELFFATWNLLLEADCDAFRDFVQGDAEMTFGEFPAEALPAAGAENYRTWERLVAQCAPRVKLRDEAGGKLTLTREAVQVEFTAQDARLGVLAEDLDDAETLADALRLVAERLNAARATAREVLERADAEDLGYYTMEQEADELANEWLDRLGFTPRHTIDAYFSIGTWIYEHGQPLEHTALAMDECRKLYKNGWRRPDGSPYVVAIADYQNEHHTPCFRIFNIDREIRAHSYRTDDGAPPKAPPPAWPELRRLAAQFKS